MDENRLAQIIAKAMYEVRNEGTFEALPERQKQLWMLDAAYIAESILEEWK